MQLKEIHKRFYAHFPETVFWQIVQADPTYDAEGHPGKKGKYTHWLLHAYQKGTITTESLNECYFLLDVFHRFRQLLEEKDIMKYDTLQRLRDVLDPYMDDPYADVLKILRAMRIRKIKEREEKAHDEEKWKVLASRPVEYVDLGLPSGTLWAQTNYCSTSPEQFGKECTVDELPDGLPTYEQAYELIEKCEFFPILLGDSSKGWLVRGPNGKDLLFRMKPNNEAYMETDSTTLWCQPAGGYTPIMVFSETNITIGMVFDHSITSQLRQVKK